MEWLACSCYSGCGWPFLINISLILLDLYRVVSLPSVVRDKLIFLSSLKWPPAMASLLLIFSDPAKSHRLIRALYQFIPKIYSHWIFEFLHFNISTYLDNTCILGGDIDGLNNQLKDSVRSATFCIHWCRSYRSVLLSSLH